MSSYHVLKHYHDPALGLGRIPRLICRVRGHAWMDDNWIQRIMIDGDTTIVNLPCLTCGRCLLKILDEAQLDWLKTGFRENEARDRRIQEMFRAAHEEANRERCIEEIQSMEHEEPPEGLEWMDGLEDEE